MSRSDFRALVIMAVILVTGLYIVLSPAISQSIPSQNASGATSSPTPFIIMRGLTFDPSNLTVSKGTTVTWTNGDYEVYKIKANDFQSGNLERGDTFTHTFNNTGTFNYADANNPSMKGTIIVT